MVDVVLYGVCSEPVLPSVCHLFVKGEFDDIIILLINIVKLNQMLIYLREVLFCLLCRGGTQTFVVLDFPLLKVLALSPLLKLVHGEK